ncbi:hypothetical protein Glove_232g202 [Diversispora epigaea]|uniref:Uncharacterized protein n=1 Tax=Diversispora epigaea TaxID=1348612 RepID=A0A397IJR7_9GLOM|nr:hypothetical protein Glove_232g202 [Diversispora epigaea]
MKFRKAEVLNVNPNDNCGCPEHTLCCDNDCCFEGVSCCDGYCCRGPDCCIFGSKSKYANNSLMRIRLTKINFFDEQPSQESIFDEKPIQNQEDNNNNIFTERGVENLRLNYPRNNENHLE